MSNKFSLLVTFVCDICAGLLREMFLKLAAEDCNQRNQVYIDLDLYLQYRNPDILLLKRKRTLRTDQVQKIVKKQPDIKSWDISILTALLLNLFKYADKQSIESIQQIRTIRNELVHLPNPSKISDNVFSGYWKTLRQEASTLAKCTLGAQFEQNIIEQIDALKEDDGKTVRDWFEETAKQLQDELQNDVRNEMEKIRYKMEYMMKDAQAKALDEMETKLKRFLPPDSPGQEHSPKKMKTNYAQMTRMKSEFKSTLDNFSSGPEAPKRDVDLRIQEILQKTNHVILIGSEDCSITEIAVTAIKNMNYDLTRCAEMCSPGDWYGIDLDDVDLVLYRNPFDDVSARENKAKLFLEVFNNIQEATDEIKIDFILTTSQHNFELFKKEHDLKLFQEVVIISETKLCQPTSDQEVERSKKQIDHGPLENVVHTHEDSEQHRELPCSSQQVIKEDQDFEQSGVNIPEQKSPGRSSSQQLIEKAQDIEQSEGNVEDEFQKFVVNIPESKHHQPSPDTLPQLIEEDQDFEQSEVNIPEQKSPGRSSSQQLIEKDQDFEQSEENVDDEFQKNGVNIPEHQQSPDTLPQLIKEDNEASEWETVTTVEDAMSLINEEKLPDKHSLCNLVKRLGKGSATVGFVCKSICTKIQETTPDVTHVFAACNVEYPNNVHFVEYFEDVLNTSSSNIDYDIVCRNNKGSENESEKIQEIKELSAEESAALKETINAESEKYMGKYKYLSAITARKIRYEEEENLCIVLYVHPCTDRYSSIPITEEPLPKEIDGYKVVVCNGVFKAATNPTADEHHPNLRMGCKITSNLGNGTGTLGGFINHLEYGLCGFTCAHVVLSQEEMIKLVKPKRRKRSRKKNHCIVYQPSKDISVEGFRAVGHVVETFYTQGDSNSAGVDLALIQIDDRFPVSGCSPSSSSGQELNFVNGKTLGRSRLTKKHEIQKFGVTTGLTNGNIYFDGMCAKLMVDLSYVAEGVIPNIQTILHNQYEIEGKDSSKFCDQGDSGALTFTIDHSNELVCIGMVIGVLNEEKHFHGVVTPITDILRELGVNQLMPFQKELTVDHLEKRLSENSRAVQLQLETANTQLKSQVKSDLSSMQSSIHNVETATRNTLSGMMERFEKTVQVLQSQMVTTRTSENNRNDNNSDV